MLTLGENDVFVECRSELEGIWGFLPGVIVNSLMLVCDQIRRSTCTYSGPRYQPSCLSLPCTCGTRYLLLVSILWCLGCTKSLTWNKNIPVMHDKVLNDVGRALDNIDVSPIHPAMVRPHGCGEKVVSRLAHGLSPWPLRSKAMPLLHTLPGGHTEAFLHNHSRSESNIRVVLHSL